MTLPALKFVPSPNFGSRHGNRIRLLVLHDMEGSYRGSVAYFRTHASQVSAHLCLNAEGSECTQMVDFADSAWAVCAYNSISISLEMEGYAKTGYSDKMLTAAAEIFAYLAHQFNIPIRHARGGVGFGICSHYDLGRDGGAHSDPSTNPAFMEKFVAMVAAAAQRHDFPAVWGLEASKHCPLDHAHARGAPAAEPDALGLQTVEGIQEALKSLGYVNSTGHPLDVDGIDGSDTDAAIREFQRHAGIAVDGVPGDATQAALLKALSGG